MVFYSSFLTIIISNNLEIFLIADTRSWVCPISTSTSTLRLWATHKLTYLLPSAILKNNFGFWVFLSISLLLLRSRSTDGPILSIRFTSWITSVGARLCWWFQSIMITTQLNLTSSDKILVTLRARWKEVWISSESHSLLWTRLSLRKQLWSHMQVFGKGWVRFLIWSSCKWWSMTR